jgi:hypothetical protein
MAHTKLQSTAPWALARLQHGVIARWQLRELAFSADAIKHRASAGRLHPVARGVYAVGRPELRDQVHAAAGITAPRFTRAQVKFEPEHVEAVLAAVARRLYSRAQ